MKRGVSPVGTVPTGDCPWFVLLLLFPLWMGTIYIIKEGNVEVGRYEEDDGTNAIHEIQEDSRSTSAVAPPRVAAPPAAQPGVKYREWFQDSQGYDAAILKQKQTQKPVFLYFYAPWCGVCKEFDQTTFKSAAVLDYLSAFPHTRINCDKEVELRKKYGVKAYPTFIVQHPSGQKKEVRRLTDAKDFLSQLKKAGLT